MTSVETVRAVAAVIGIIGAMVAASDAFATVCRDVYSWLAATQRSYRPPVFQIHAHDSFQLDDIGIRDSLTAMLWSPVTERQIEILRARTESQQAELADLRGVVIRTLESELPRTARTIRAEIQTLQLGLRAEKVQTTRIEAAGFPVIAIAFVLAGLPDSLVDRRWVALGVIVAAIVMTTVAVSVFRRRLTGRRVGNPEG